MGFTRERSSWLLRFVDVKALGLDVVEQFLSNAVSVIPPPHTTPTPVLMVPVALEDGWSSGREGIYNNMVLFCVLLGIEVECFLNRPFLCPLVTFCLVLVGMFLSE